MNTYMCRIIGYDDSDEWHAVKAPTAAEAAEWYAQSRDREVEGDLFNELTDEHAVAVRHGNELEVFSVAMEYEKTYSALKTIRRAA